MHVATQCRLVLFMAMLAPALPACRSIRKLSPLARVPPTSVQDPQASPASSNNPLALTGREAPAAASAGSLPSLDAIDSKLASTISLDPRQAVYDLPTTRPTSQSLINALETEFPTLAVNELADNELAVNELAVNELADNELADNELADKPSVPPAPSTPAQSTPAIRLVIAGVRPGYGVVKVAVFTDGSAFPQPSGAVQTLSLPPSHSTLEQALHLNSAFAVAVYQDINGDGELTRNRLGVPVEPFAFSNNAMGQRKPPSFEQAKVPLPVPSAFPLTLTINLP